MWRAWIHGEGASDARSMRLPRRQRKIAEPRCEQRLIVNAFGNYCGVRPSRTMRTSTIAPPSKKPLNRIRVCEYNLFAIRRLLNRELITVSRVVAPRGLCILGLRVSL